MGELTHAPAKCVLECFDRLPESRLFRRNYRYRTVTCSDWISKYRLGHTSTWSESAHVRMYVFAVERART